MKNSEASCLLYNMSVGQEFLLLNLAECLILYSRNLTTRNLTLDVTEPSLKITPSSSKVG